MKCTGRYQNRLTFCHVNRIFDLQHVIFVIWIYFRKCGQYAFALDANYDLIRVMHV